MFSFKSGQSFRSSFRFIFLHILGGAFPNDVLYSEKEKILKITWTLQSNLTRILIMYVLSDMSCILYSST